jgi:hypothetical protein
MSGDCVDDIEIIDEIEAKTDSDGEDVITTVSDREKIEGILKENASDFDTLSGTLSVSDILDDGESQSTHSGSIIDVESEGESEEDVESKNKRDIAFDNLSEVLENLQITSK